MRDNNNGASPCLPDATPKPTSPAVHSRFDCRSSICRLLLQNSSRYSMVASFSPEFPKLHCIPVFQRLTLLSALFWHSPFCEFLSPTHQPHHICHPLRS